MPEDVRLNRYLAQAGVASRRGADELIEAGRVAVDGTVVREHGMRVGPDATVTLDGRPVRTERLVHLLLHKPLGVVTTLSDPEGRKTVRDLVDVDERVFPVGRLDAMTTGLLLLTNDGELAQRLAHPKHGVDKTYRATLSTVISADQVRRLERGMQLEDGRTWPARVEIVVPGPTRSVVDITIHEGRNRQVRRMLAALGLGVRTLERTRYGPLDLGTLPPGAWRPLRPREVERLRRA